MILRGPIHSVPSFLRQWLLVLRFPVSMPLLMTVMAQAYQVSPSLFFPGIPDIQRHLRMSLHMVYMVHGRSSSINSIPLAILAFMAIHMQNIFPDF